VSRRSPKPRHGRPARTPRGRGRASWRAGRASSSTRPLVAEGIDRLRLTHTLVEPDDEPLPPPDALSEDRVGKPCRPDLHGHGGRALVPEASQHRAELGPRRALDETGGSIWAPYGGQDREGAAEGCPVTAEDGEVVAGGVLHPRILARHPSRARLRLPPQNRARHGPATEPRTLLSALNTPS